MIDVTSYMPYDFSLVLESKRRQQSQRPLLLWRLLIMWMGKSKHSGSVYDAFRLPAWDKAVWRSASSTSQVVHYTNARWLVGGGASSATAVVNRTSPYQIRVALVATNSWEEMLALGLELLHPVGSECRC